MSKKFDSSDKFDQTVLLLMKQKINDTDLINRLCYVEDFDVMRQCFKDEAMSKLSEARVAAYINEVNTVNDKYGFEIQALPEGYDPATLNIIDRKTGAVLKTWNNSGSPTFS